MTVKKREVLLENKQNKTPYAYGLLIKERMNVGEEETMLFGSLYARFNGQLG